MIAYSVMRKPICLLLSLALLLTLAACAAPTALQSAATEAPADVSEPPAVESPTGLKSLYEDSFRMGVSCEAISHWGNRLSEIGNPEKENLILQEFNSITFGNELKPAYNMDYSSPEATETDLPFGHNRAAIEMLDWAKANGIPVRGHTLIWHSQCEDAVFCKNYKPVHLNNGSLDPECLVDAETMKSRMESYIHHVMEYMYANGYGDVIYAWDVVNEAIEPGHNEEGMRESYWYQIIGPEFLYDAFKYAREATEKYAAEYADLYSVDASDPEALKTIQPKLFYNDYNEFQPGKQKAILRAIEPIVADGYLDGIGMQGHLSVTTNLATYITALKKYSEAVSEVHITELDVAQTASGLKAEYNQAVFYRTLFAALREARRNGANLTCVTLWGLTDDNSWKKEASPLIFNGDLSPKLAYTGLVTAATGEPLPEPQQEAPAPSAADLLAGREEGFEAQSHIALPRGTGHMPALTVTGAEAHSGEKSLLVTREAQEATVQFNVGDYAGRNVEVTAFVKTSDDTIRMGLENDTAAVEMPSSDDWTEVRGIFAVPEGQTAAQVYIETSGNADILIDDVSIRLGGVQIDLEDGQMPFSPRWQGAGTLEIVEEDGNHVAKLSNQDQTYYGICYDMTPFLGMEIQLSFDVKTDDSTVKVTGDIDGVWPNYLVAATAPGSYKTVSGIVRLPGDLDALRVYIETPGTADLYIDNFSIRIA